MRIAAMLLLLSTLTTSNNVRRGYAAHYGVGRMERAAQLHGLSATKCMVASSWYPLGTWLDVKSHVTERTLRCRVSDVTHPRDVREVRRRNIVIEFGAANIKAMCNLDFVAQEPPRKCPVTVWTVNNNG